MRRRGPPLAIALVALGASVAVACGADEEAASTTAIAAESDCAEVQAPPPRQDRFDKPGQALDPGQRATATVRTSCGSFEITLDTERSPQTTNSFAFLAEQGFYDDTAFHGIDPGFVIQGGDQKGDGTGGPGYSVREPPPQRTTYRTGLMAMGKTAIEPPGTSGSQFFIVTAPADAGLQPDYAVLGRVTEGLDVVEAIDELGDPATKEPVRPVTIESITIDAR